MKRLGILGGTFDPIHQGHLVIAEEARAQLDLPEVRFIPAGQPPHKRGQAVTSAAHRLAMVRLAVAANPAFSVSSMEIDRPGASYSVETVSEVAVTEGTDCQIYFVVGGDALPDLLTWRAPHRLLELCTLVVVRRPNVAAVNIEALERQLPALRQRLVFLEGPQFDISGSDLRRRVAAGLPIRYQVPESVHRYIREHGLFRLPAMQTN